jgi:undecaprenyl phosphate N,N'-diacetylbacillosamine 1-phosphate transferase
MFRFLDLLILFLILPIFLPLFAILYMLALYFHCENVFFFQPRLGKNMKIFNLIKFRSMVIGAQNMGTGLYSFSDDNRITPFGKFLRTTSLDELPQLLNIFYGEMSFIGPRPAVVGELESETDLPENYMLRFSVKPGLTGWAQIHGRDNLNWAQKIKYDIQYIKTKGVKKFIITIYILIYTPIYLFKFSATYEKK